MNYSQYIGIPFESKGRDPESGLDCWGLCIHLFQKRGIMLPDFRSDYLSATDKKNIPLLVYAEQYNWEQLDQPEEGAVIVFDIAGLPFHVGYCIGRERGKWKFIHVHKDINTCVEELYSSIWKNRIEGIYRYE